MLKRGGWGAKSSRYLEAVVSDDTQERDDGVNDAEESHGWLHVPCALLQEIVQGTFLLLLIPSVIKSRTILRNTRAFKEAWAFKQPRTFKVLLAWRAVRHLRHPDTQSALWNHPRVKQLCWFQFRKLDRPCRTARWSWEQRRWRGPGTVSYKSCEKDNSAETKVTLASVILNKTAEYSLNCTMSAFKAEGCSPWI